MQSVLPLPWKEASAEAVNAGPSDCNLKVLLLVSFPARKMERGPSPKAKPPSFSIFFAVSR